MRISPSQARRLGIAPEPARKRKDAPRGKVGAFAALCVAHGLPEPLPEYMFHPTRRWRIDYFFPPDLAVEVEGGAWVGGRHTRGSGFVADMAKYNALTLAGIRLIRVTPADVTSGAAFALVKRALGEGR